MDFSNRVRHIFFVYLIFLSKLSPLIKLMAPTKERLLMYHCSTLIILH